MSYVSKQAYAKQKVGWQFFCSNFGPLACRIYDAVRADLNLSQ